MYWLIGGSGSMNYGDELIVRGWMSHLSREESVKNIRIETNSKVSSERFHEEGVESAKEYGTAIVFDGFLYGLCGSVAGLSFWEQFVRGAEFFDKGGVDIYGEENFDFIDSVRAIHLHGGGYFNDIFPWHGFILGFTMSLAKREGISAMATGVGLMPMRKPNREQREKFVSLMDCFSVFELRDVESFRLVKSLSGGKGNVVNGFDDNFMLKREDLFSCDEHGGANLVLSFIEHDICRMSRSYLKRLSEYARGFDRVVFWECYPWQDENVIEFMRNYISDLEVVCSRDWVYARGRLSQNDRVIVSRFHPHFCAARVGVSGVYNIKGRYYDVKHGSIVALGSGFGKGSLSRLIRPEKRQGVLCLYDEELTSMKRKIVDIGGQDFSLR